MRRHPYRELEIVPEPPPPRRALPADDIALATIVGVLGTIVSLSSDGMFELSWGLLLLAVAGMILAAARCAARL